MFPIIYLTLHPFLLIAQHMWATAAGARYNATPAVPAKLLPLVHYHTRPEVVHAMRHGMECTRAALGWKCVPNQIP